MKKEIRKYVKFREDNDWEGETWDFYIPVEDNEEAIKRLAEIIEEYPNYTLYPIPIDEEKVDILIKNDDEIGYMARHNKLKGKLNFSDFPNKSTNGKDDPFYKGEIGRYLE